MNSSLQQIDLIDLIFERHDQLRKLLEKQWNDISDIYISNSEWFILAHIYQQEQTTMAYISKHVDLTRQAIHKFIKRLEENGLVEINDFEHDKKKKSVELTSLGKECFAKNESLKSEIKRQISEKVGCDQINILKDILSLDWGLQST